MDPPLLTLCRWPPVLLVTLSHQVSLVPLARPSLRELLALLVLHHPLNPLRHTLVPLPATSLVSLVFLPLLPLSLFSFEQPKHVYSP
jgi:hypothetical protein